MYSHQLQQKKTEIQQGYSLLQSLCVCVYVFAKEVRNLYLSIDQSTSFSMETHNRPFLLEMKNKEKRERERMRGGGYEDTDRKA